MLCTFIFSYCKKTHVQRVSTLKQCPPLNCIRVALGTESRPRLKYALKYYPQPALAKINPQVLIEEIRYSHVTVIIMCTVNHLQQLNRISVTCVGGQSVGPVVTTMQTVS